LRRVRASFLARLSELDRPEMAKHLPALLEVMRQVAAVDGETELADASDEEWRTTLEQIEVNLRLVEGATGRRLRSMIASTLPHLTGEYEQLESKFVERSRALVRRIRARLDESAGYDDTAPPVWASVEAISKAAPLDEWSKLPRDGAANVDHYLYGHPKKAS
jgi:hypothetical protein